ncbi:hypothetical protein LCGC14_2967290, partial [marine sediment metagenome]
GIDSIYHTKLLIFVKIVFQFFKNFYEKLLPKLNTENL